MKLFKGIESVMTMAPAMKKQGRKIGLEDLGLQKKVNMLVDRGQIVLLQDQAKKIPTELKKKVKSEVDCRGLHVVPGLVECHTHTVFSGERAAEFEQRLNGVPYQEIAAKGGGILSTMRKTRAESRADLLGLTQKRVNQFVRQGVTTLEVKSGYALNLKDELKMLEVAKNLKGPRIVKTFLGAHALPPEFKTYSEYLEYLAEQVLPVIKKKELAERVDIFIEKGFFSAQDGQKYLRQAQELGFEVVIHADQLSLSGGADLAVELGALSADHVIQVKDQQIARLAQSSVTAVLLPAADLYMRCEYPPARALIDAGARVALATDFNPGTSPTQDTALTGLLARLQMKMSLPEVWSAYTVGAAYALGLEQRVGSLEIGKSADFICTHAEWSEFFYSAGNQPVHAVFREGRALFRDSK